MSEFAKEVREAFAEDEEADRENRDEMLADLKICAFEQWNEQVRQMRENRVDSLGNALSPLPCLTINTTNQFVNQVVGDWRSNQVAIKVLPREDGDKEVAEIRSELIRSIELQSKATRVYTIAFEQAVRCGQGAFEIALDYAYDDAFERDIFIRGIANPLAVLFDSMAADPTARDATRAWKIDRLRKAEYEQRFPDAAPPSTFDSEATEQGWSGDDSVRIAEYWRLVERPRTIAMMQSGKVIDVTGRKLDGWQQFAALDPNGQPRIRKAMCKYATMVVTNGQEELTDPFELKLPRLPIIRVMGQEVWVGDKRVRFGLVRAMRDPLMLKNYSRSVVAELLMGMQRANFVASAAAVKNREKDWPNTLVYNDGAQAPVDVTTKNLLALIQESQLYAQDMKDVTGLHDASLGAKSNETSGIAIQRRQNEGDIATIFFSDHMNEAVQEGGEVINALLPVTHDTARTARLVGQDDMVKMQRINDPNDPDSIDIGVGRYDVTISTGPAYATRRQEAGAQLMELARGHKPMMERAGDLIVKALDVPDGDELAERLRPEGIPGDEDELTPEQQQEMAQQAQEAQMAKQMQMQMAQAELRKTMAEAAKAEADADKARAEADKARIEAQETEAKIALGAAALVETALEPEPAEEFANVE